MPPRKDDTTTTLGDDIEQYLLLKGFPKTFLAEHIRALIRNYGLRGIKSDGSDGLLYDILFLDNITTDHFAQFQPMWENRYSEDPGHKKWWKTFRGFVRDCFNKSRDQINDFFRQSHPEESQTKKWFPRPAKMAPPKPDIETPPPMAITVNRKRGKPTETIGAAGLSETAGKRHSKRARTEAHAPRTPGDWDAGSGVSEKPAEKAIVISDDDPAVPGTPPTAPTLETPRRSQSRETANPPPPPPPTSPQTLRDESREPAPTTPRTSRRRKRGEPAASASFPVASPTPPMTPRRSKREKLATSAIPAPPKTLGRKKRRAPGTSTSRGTSRGHMGEASPNPRPPTPAVPSSPQPTNPQPPGSQPLQLRSTRRRFDNWGRLLVLDDLDAPNGGLGLGYPIGPLPPSRPERDGDQPEEEGNQPEAEGQGQ